MSQVDQLHEAVQDRYAAAARAAASGTADSDAAASCCGPSGDAVFGEILYSADDRASLPDTAVLASLGCGNPTAVAELRAGETVLDLGSGGGIDVLLSARRVGPRGRAIGLDMTDEMLELARRSAAEAGVGNVEWVKGTIEAMPIADATIDVVISNCVINLAADKELVFREIARVLRPGGRVGVSDVVGDDSLSVPQRAERGSFVGCIAGALSFEEYRAGLEAAGLTDVHVEPTHAVADGLFGAVVRATKPATWTPASMHDPVVSLPRPQGGLPVLEAPGCGRGCAC